MNSVIVTNRDRGAAFPGEVTEENIGCDPGESKSMSLGSAVCATEHLLLSDMPLKLILSFHSQRKCSGIFFFPLESSYAPAQVFLCLM